MHDTPVQETETVVLRRTTASRVAPEVPVLPITCRIGVIPPVAVNPGPLPLASLILLTGVNEVALLAVRGPTAMPCLVPLMAFPSEGAPTAHYSLPLMLILIL